VSGAIRPRLAGICSMATRAILAEVAAAFEREIGIAVAIESAGGVDAARRVAAGEPFDVTVLARDAIDRLIAAGWVVAGSAVDLARSGVAAAIRAGAPRPDIASEEALRRAVLAAPTVGCSTGPSGAALARLFERWGIANEIAGRLVVAPPGVPVGALLARGEVALGFQQLSELIHEPGIEVLGPLPAAVQIVTVFAGGVCAGSRLGDEARRLLEFARSPAADEIKRRHGMAPA
jgi:molybdate transport system substrate-binding protein